MGSRVIEWARRAMIKLWALMNDHAYIPSHRQLAFLAPIYLFLHDMYLSIAAPAAPRHRTGKRSPLVRNDLTWMLAILAVALSLRALAIQRPLAKPTSPGPALSCRRLKAMADQRPFAKPTSPGPALSHAV